MASRGGGSLQFFSPTRQALLAAMKDRGEITIDQLSEETLLSPGAVRQHLLALEAQGLVSYIRVREGPGRPRHVFRLTTQGEDLFPQQYAFVANEVLRALTDEGEDLVDRVFTRITESQVKLVTEQVNAPERKDRIDQLVDLLDQSGYFPLLDLSNDLPATITLRHCPVLRVASEFPRICEVESHAIRSVFPGAVTRTKHRPDGDAVCEYCID
ncbi:MAG TPA: ArsR family transcriptional regulator [Tepidiformaceae bacterium]|nr:ArsR family transcriptional regulator [Tepidiformaceae bacterium]